MLLKIFAQIHQCQMVSLVDSFRYKRITIYTDYYTNRRGGNTSHFVLGDQHDLLLNLTRTFQRKKIKTLVMSNWPSHSVSFPHYQQAGRLSWIRGRGEESGLGPSWTWKTMQSNPSDYLQVLARSGQSQKWLKKHRKTDLEDEMPD